MSFVHTVLCCSVLLLGIAESLSYPEHPDDPSFHSNAALRDFRNTFWTIATENCLNASASVPAPPLTCGIKLMAMLLDQPKMREATAKCEIRSTTLVRIMLTNFLDQNEDLAKKKYRKRRFSSKVKRDSASKVMDLQAMDFNMPLLGYINTVNVTNLEKFLKMQINAKAQMNIDKLRKLQESGE